MPRKSRQQQYNDLCEEVDRISAEIIKCEKDLGPWQEILPQDGLNAIERRVAETRIRNLNLKMGRLYESLEEAKSAVDVHLGVGNTKFDVEEPLSVGQEE